MATRQDEGGSRLWRGIQHLIFGEDSEPTLREEIEEAIDEAEESQGSHVVAGDLSPAEREMLRNLLHFGEQTAGDICVTRGEIMAVPTTSASRTSSLPLWTQDTAACRSMPKASMRWWAWSISRTSSLQASSRAGTARSMP